MNQSRTDLVERPDGGEAQRRFGGAAEELQHRHGGRQLLGRRVLHVDDGVRSLVDDHLALVTQTALNELKHWAVRSGKVKISAKDTARKRIALD